MQYSENFIQDLFFYIDVQCDEIGIQYPVIEAKIYEPDNTVTVDEALDIEAMWNEAEPIAF